VFSGAIISLMVAVGAAVLGFGGLPDATAATFAQHLFLIATGLFVISALVVILDLELPHIGGLVMRSKLSETGFPKAVVSRCDLSLIARFSIPAGRHSTRRARINAARAMRDGVSSQS
jgi:uncharacterized membrane protein YtjA (UPF0391 family)